MQGNGLAGSSTRLSLVPRTAWCYEQTNDATDQPSGGNAPPDGVIQWAERLCLVPEQKNLNIAPACSLECLKRPPRASLSSLPRA
jgi:hypothetical protein